MTMPTPEDKARQKIDTALATAGWVVQDAERANLHAGRGVAVREFVLKSGHGKADYLLFVDRQAVGVVEAKALGTTLTGVERQTRRYAAGLPAHLPCALDPLPFLYQTTGVETRFTDLLDPEPRSREVFCFHRPETLAEGLEADPLPQATPPRPSSLRGRLRTLPPLDAGGLWPAQERAVRGLERSLAEGRPRALIQMATGSGKTFAAIAAAYRMIRFGGARRVLFLVDRGNLGRQALKEFQQYRTPDDGRKLTELYNVQHPTSSQLQPVARVVISTIQRLYSMLRGQELDPADEERSLFDEGDPGDGEPLPVSYSARLPIETFDVVIIDECHRSIYNRWAQVVEYFDAFLIGLTATPSQQTLGFFRRNLVMEYGHAEAVADGVNVGFEIYRIRTRITEAGSQVEAGYYVRKRDRRTRARRWEQLDETLAYGPQVLDRDVVAADQIRTVVRTFKERLFTEIFPGRTEVPKTLIFAKSDSHADDVVRVVREEFGRGDEFAVKITYRTLNAKPDDLIQAFRTAYYPRIVVTVDMIATGTDVKPIEIVMFLRSVGSRGYFEQMKGRGVRVIAETDFRAVTPDARVKDHFVLVDCVGVCEREMVDSQPLERERSKSFRQLLNAVGFGSREVDVVSTLAGRLARLDRRLSVEQRARVSELSGGLGVQGLVRGMLAALDPDAQVAEWRRRSGVGLEVEPSAEELARAEAELVEAAVLPLAANPELRAELLDFYERYEQTIDEVSIDEVRQVGFGYDPELKARGMVESFERFLVEHRDEIAALELLYSRPYARRLRLQEVRELAAVIQKPPRSWTPELLWQAYEILDRDRVRGASGRRLLTDRVALVRFGLHQEAELVPFPEQVAARFAGWLAQQENHGRRFTEEQRQWLEAIRDHVAASLGIEMEDFDYVPFQQRGGARRAHEVFGAELPGILADLNEVLAA